MPGGVRRRGKPEIMERAARGAGWPVAKGPKWTRWHSRGTLMPPDRQPSCADPRAWVLLHPFRGFGGARHYDHLMVFDAVRGEAKVRGDLTEGIRQTQFVHGFRLYKGRGTGLTFQRCAPASRVGGKIRTGGIRRRRGTRRGTAARASGRFGPHRRSLLRTLELYRVNAEETGNPFE
jgi:hypothetical protein